MPEFYGSLDDLGAELDRLAVQMPSVSRLSVILSPSAMIDLTPDSLYEFLRGKGWTVEREHLYNREFILVRTQVRECDVPEGATLVLLEEKSGVTSDEEIERISRICDAKDARVIVLSPAGEVGPLLRLASAGVVYRALRDKFEGDWRRRAVEAIKKAMDGGGFMYNFCTVCRGEEHDGSVRHREDCDALALLREAEVERVAEDFSTDGPGPCDAMIPVGSVMRGCRKRVLGGRHLDGQTQHEHEDPETGMSIRWS